ncbi:MAG: elongation factor P [Abditibacteriota bacterium]|nr:elongation factor P [Abditibacteriota bacterium]MBP5094065.1 elongation factor P [Abditibacteriota bacterium]MBP5717827.1 elongation factor P [Abditibacteriota bacterium]MBP5739002.1 elongation factor P [Abditibacteriota bacterium]
MDTSDFRNGLSIIMDNNIYTIVDFQHVKPGKGGAFVRSKLKNIRTGATIEKTWRAGEKMDQAILERFPMEFSYSQDDEYFFMDTDSYEMVPIAKEAIGDGVKYLKEGLEVTALSHKGEIINIELPITVEAEVIETAPGEKGDTASGGSKPATIDTGVVVNVPFFINIGDKIKVDTRTDSYLERVKN